MATISTDNPSIDMVLYAIALDEHRDASFTEYSRHKVEKILRDSLT